MNGPAPTFDDLQLRRWAETEVDAVLDDLPPVLRARAQRVPVTLESVPNRAQEADGIGADTLGLFTGAAFEDEDHSPWPPQIILFLENLWTFAEADEAVFRQEVRTTLLHELGHYLGLDEGDLAQRGLE